MKLTNHKYMNNLNYVTKTPYDHMPTILLNIQEKYNIDIIHRPTAKYQQHQHIATSRPHCKHLQLHLDFCIKVKTIECGLESKCS